MSRPFSLRAWGALGLVLAACGAHETFVLRVEGPATEVKSSLDDDALDLRLAAAAQSMSDQGFVRGAFQDRGFLPTNGRVARPVLIPAHTCAKFVAVATPSVIDLDAALYRPDGAAWVEDDGSDARPTLSLCAGEIPVSAYYTLHAYQGVGAYETAQFLRPAISGDDLTSPEVRGSALSDLAKTLNRRGFEDAAARVEMPLSAGRPVRLGVSVKPGECYTLAVDASQELHDLSLRLLANDGRELANGGAESGLAALQYCADVAEDLELELLAHAGSGSVRVGRFRASQAVVGGAHALWLGEPTPSPRAWTHARSAAAMRKELEARGVKSFLVEERPLAQARIAEVEVKHPLAFCETWHALLGPGLAKATLRAESMAGELLGQADSRGASAELELCGRQGPMRVHVIGRAGFGAVTLVGEPRSAKTAAQP